MEAEMSYLLEEQARKLENAEMLIERLKREVKELNFSVALHERSVEKARAIWEEAHPDAEFMPGRTELMVWLIERAERAEAVKESLKASLMEISGFSAYWKYLRGNEEAWENVWNIATDALISLRTAEESSVVDTTAKQPEGTTKLDKALQNTTVVKRVLVENSCPSEFGLEDCEYSPDTLCLLSCEDCWEVRG